MLNIERVLPGKNVSVDVAVILLKLHFLEKLRYTPEDLAMNVTVNPPDFEEILRNWSLPSKHINWRNNATEEIEEIETFICDYQSDILMNRVTFLQTGQDQISSFTKMSSLIRATDVQEEESAFMSRNTGACH
ncbi:hypothetical protein CDAR_613051 [Caerostris darwini]|uniref:Uncharacterized protein n=1 Tax=Caerostris darwini TaxID=1538125 RepID=A0AAV4PIL2_9ARAC|nr:hypothetical protein CDAR_613051 [Caerostris darwini]